MAPALPEVSAGGSPIVIKMPKVPVTFTFSPAGSGTQIKIDVAQAFDGGSTLHNYHIHEGQCGSEQDHWDPLGAKKSGTPYSCNKANLASCELGDLSGKFGQLSGQPKSYTYMDSSLPFSMLPGDNLSLIIHTSNPKLELDCVNMDNSDDDDDDDGDESDYGSPY